MGIFRRHTSSTLVAEPAEPAAAPIAETPQRQHVTVVGSVTQMRTRPTSGVPALAVTVADSSGSVVVVWTGRRSLGGVALGRRIAVHGVAVRHGGQLEFTNPTYTLLPPARH